MQNAEYPWQCEFCKVLNMIGLDTLQAKPLDKLVTEHGFECEKCGMWCVVKYSTESLRVAKHRLETLDVKRTDFRYHFGKVMRKAEGIREKAEQRLAVSI